MRRNVARGFTLIEVLIALGIMAILGALVYPTYQGAVRKAKRAEARVALLRLMQQQERYYTQRTTYLAFSADSIDPDAKRFQWFSGDNPAASAYEIRGTPCPGETLQTCIVLSARPGTARVNTAFIDTECGELSFSSSGIKTPARPECW